MRPARAFRLISLLPSFAFAGRMPAFSRNMNASSNTVAQLQSFNAGELRARLGELRRYL